ncbi:MAG: glycosyltransferase [Clostridiales bacterium]|jgi:UDP-N-acetylglucosamine:LPS N-acetylglucosamine transferase|nr:glycosyltransferase [Clostridiales bacterium]OPZ67114.1 MAG: Processive diacylglycerol beta-glucosyltransferase [Firmicutes bacterium ADurb.Bin467]
MKKKILLITTTHTGCGHKSISDSLMDWLKEMPEIQVVQIDGFEQLVSKHVKTIGDSYGVVTRHAKFLWKWTWDFGTRFNDAYCDLMSTWSEKRFLEIIEREKPDVVLTTHPMFNSSLLSVCERNGLKLPFVSVQADPVTVHPSWCDPRAALTICATDEAAQLTRRYGVPKERILKIGFPTRRRFTDLAQKIDKLPYDPSRPARCLMMSGGEGSGMLGRYALALLSGTDAKLTIVCGRNKQLKKRLETLLKRKYGERVRILGFVTEIENLMLESDIMIARGSPNSFFEGIVMNVPLVITGALPGQEQGNPELVERYDLGVVCEGLRALPAVVRHLLADGGKELRRIQESQRRYRRFDNALRIAQAARDLAIGAQEDASASGALEG